MNADLWIDRSTPATRDKLIKQHLPLVEFLARRVSTTLPNTVEVDNLISYGTFGLLDAIEKFDPDREVKFETYASVRIRGAMIDGLRSGDWLPRQVRTSVTAVDRAHRSLQVDLRRAPNHTELADELGLSLPELRSVLAHPAGRVASLDQQVSDGDDEPTSYGATLPSHDDRPDEAYEVAELLERLARAIGRLDERERAVLSGYYIERKSLPEIARALRISESRTHESYLGGLVRLRSLMVVDQRLA
jgi:RNA polymerase sigma factor for flagellar operon FliA